MDNFIIKCYDASKLKNRVEITMLYVIQVETGKEEYILDHFNSERCKDIISDAFIPLIKKIIKVQGKHRVVEQRIFPGYVFVETDCIGDVQEILRTIPSFTRILGKDSKYDEFVPLSKEEEIFIYKISNKETNHITELSQVDFDENNHVKIIAGPLFGMEGMIKKFDLHKRTAIVETELLGRKVLLRLGIEILIKKEI